MLSDCDMSSGKLELEMTESIMADFPLAERILYQLNDLGVKISIDDFGTGYSSLSYLSRLPVHKLKIDQSFLNPLSNRNKTIVKTIIGLAKNLNMEIIAEGVEHEEQVSFLIQQNCDQAQGYFYGKPMRAKAVEERLAMYLHN
ncbi:EAL domain-containing protein [Sutcliffiella sp. NC1]|nr:EAL domain-containing protein [Sutcliffiella sp. NC1]WBL17695.1 EAL domain-containing protein [Sutcliffiella sp. NC1]